LTCAKELRIYTGNDRILWWLEFTV